MNSLALRIFLAFFATLVLTALGAIAVTSWLINERRASAETELLDSAEEAATALADGGIPALEAWAKRRSRDPRLSVDVLVIDETGVDLLGRPLPPPASPTIAAAEDPWVYDLPAVLLDLPRTTAEVVSDEGEVFQLLAVPRRTGLAVWRDIPAPVLLLSLVVTTLMSFWLARSITRPILALQGTTESLAGGNLKARVSAKTRRRRDELGRLALSLDAMASRLETLIRGQQQLLRDISHEVRSPLSRIRLAAGLLAQRDASAAAAAGRIDEEVSRLDELIDQILDVSRLESGAVTLNREPIELTSLVERVLADASFEATQIGKTLVHRIAATPLPMRGDRHWVQSAIENVVRNALTHTPAGAIVEVSLHREADTAKLLVVDSGGGIPDEESSRIFEPFYRSSSTNTGSRSGTGLGLAIAARVVHEHQGRIEARNLHDAAGRVTGFEICLLWPLSAPDLSPNRAAGAP